MGNTEEHERCLKPGLGCIVLVWILIATLALILSYSIARSTGHISPFVPAISDTTSKNPEGAIFAELFNATAVFTLVMIAIRYYQVKMINRQVEGGESSHLSQLNLLSIFFGIGSALGASIVANFRSSEVSTFIQKGLGQFFSNSLNSFSCTKSYRQSSWLEINLQEN